MAAEAIILIRHARPVDATEGMSLVEDDERPLSSDGRLAAERLAEQLMDEPVSAVFSSPYRRAIDTVRLVADRHRVNVRIHPDLRERRISKGSLPPDAFRDALERAREEPTFSLPGGESTDEVLARVVRALGEIAGATAGGVAVAGTHGGWISILRWSVGHTFTVEEALREPMPAAYRLQDIDGDWRIDRIEQPPSDDAVTGTVGS